MFVLLKEEAQKILDAFGPCTTLYECSSVEDLIRDAGDDFDSLPQMLDCLCRVERVQDERFIDSLVEGGMTDPEDVKLELENTHKRADLRELTLKLLFGYDASGRSDVFEQGI